MHEKDSVGGGEIERRSEWDSLGDVAFGGAEKGRESVFDAMRGVIEPVKENWQGLPTEEKTGVLGQLFDTLSDEYGDKERQKPIPIVFYHENYLNKGWTFNRDGFVRAPIEEIEKSKLEDSLFSLFHEFRHSIQDGKVGGVESSFATSPFDHDTMPQELDATKFAFDALDQVGLDKTNVKNYERWMKAFRAADNREKLEKVYGPSAADQYYSALDNISKYRQEQRARKIEPENSLRERLRRASYAHSLKSDANRDLQKLKQVLGDSTFGKDILASLTLEMKAP